MSANNPKKRGPYKKGSLPREEVEMTGLTLPGLGSMVTLSTVDHTHLIEGNMSLGRYKRKKNEHQASDNWSEPEAGEGQDNGGSMEMGCAHQGCDTECLENVPSIEYCKEKDVSSGSFSHFTGRASELHIPANKSVFDDILTEQLQYVMSHVEPENEQEPLVEDDAECIQDVDGVNEYDEIWYDVSEYVDENVTLSVNAINETKEQSANEMDSEIDDQPLYDGASVSLGSTMLLITLFMQKYKLPSHGITQLLQLLNILLPSNNILCRSFSRMRKYLFGFKNGFKSHYYCVNCLQYLGCENDSVVCPNSACGKDLTMTNSTEHFIEMPVKCQLQNFFKAEGFYESLQGRFKRQKQCDYEDIYDGEVYKKLFEGQGPLSNTNNISFVLNTDGAPIFKSNNVSMWPIFLAINELPCNRRFTRDNMIFAGMWLSNKKPAMTTFLKPFHDSFMELSKGIHVVPPSQGQIVCKAYVLACTADLPARCMICNCMQHNGAFGCWKCEQEGATAAVGKGHCHVFPYQGPEEGGPKEPKRTAETVMNHAKEVIIRQTNGEKISHVQGIKGASWLMLLPEFDCVSGVVIDYMHGILLGVTKLMLRLWFSPSFKAEKFSVSNQALEVNLRLATIKPTLDITRMPTDVSDLKHWKASEFRCFLLYFAAPILHGILDETRFQHLLKLVTGISILLKSSISKEKLQEADVCILEFVRDFALLYDLRFMTLNIHQCVHLADEVRNLGPLYNYSCFPFEDKNGFILKMIRGSRHVDSQVVGAISMAQKLPELQKRCTVQGSPESALCEEMLSKDVVCKGEKLMDGCFVLGGVRLAALSADDMQAVSECVRCALQVRHFKIFSRIFLNGNLIYGTSYKRMSSRDNSVVKYYDLDENVFSFGKVKFFLQYSDVATEIKHNIAIINPLAQSHHDPGVHIHLVNGQTRPKAISISAIDSLCIFVEFKVSSSNETSKYVCEFPNRFETL